MRYLQSVVALGLAIFAIALVIGCVPAFLSKNRTATEVPVARPGAPGEAGAKPAQSESSAKAVQDLLLPPPPPSYKAASSSGKAKEALPAEPREMVIKNQINKAALTFANEIPNVQHVKTCYSREFGGWYLLLYIKKKDGVSLQHYAWDPKAEEWEVSYRVEHLPDKEVQFHLKGEVGDERCTVLK